MTSDDSSLNSWKREAAAAVGKRKGAAAIPAGGGERIVEIVLLKVCISPEEEAIASKASGIHVCKSVCLFVCPKHQKTKPIDKYLFLYC